MLHRNQEIERSPPICYALGKQLCTRGWVPGQHLLDPLPCGGLFILYLSRQKRHDCVAEQRPCS
jgi:hypothetical protein